MKPTNRFLFHLSPELKARIEQAARARETTASSFVRGAVIEKLEREQNAPKPQPPA